MRALGRLLAILVAGGLVLPAGAGAVLRKAAPGGATTGDCVATPCSLFRADDVMTAADELLVAPGTYALGENPTVGVVGLWRGDPALPRPVITSGGTQTATIVVNGGTLRHLRVEKTASTGALTTLDGRVEDCIVVGPFGISISRFGRAVVSSTTVLATRTAVTVEGAPSAGPQLITGSTLVSSGPQAEEALEVQTSFADASVELRNSIARSTGSVDVRLVAAADRLASFRGRSSAFRALAYSGPGFFNDGFATAGVDANTAATPLLADVAAGDVHQLPGSPTIDRGDPTLVEPGAQELDGQKRTMGAQPDMGVDEVAPRPQTPVVSVGATTVDAASGVVSVDASGSATSVEVEYGPTTAYGSSVTVPAGDANGKVDVPFTLTGLTAGTTYQVRARATNPTGQSVSPNVSFVTAAPPQAPLGSGPPLGTPPIGTPPIGTPPVVPPPARDRRAPRLTAAKLSRSKAGRLRLTGRLDEAARVRFRVLRGRKAVGRSATVRVRAGLVAVTVPRIQVSALRSGRVLEVVATDAAGNRAAARRLRAPRRT